jgi:hypothetical protein
MEVESNHPKTLMRKMVDNVFRFFFCVVLTLLSMVVFGFWVNTSYSNSQLSNKEFFTYSGLFFCFALFLTYRKKEFHILRVIGDAMLPLLIFFGMWSLLGYFHKVPYRCHPMQVQATCAYSLVPCMSYDCPPPPACPTIEVESCVSVLQFQFWDHQSGVLKFK